MLTTPARRVESGEWSGTVPTCEPSMYVARIVMNIVCT